MLAKIKEAILGFLYALAFVGVLLALLFLGGARAAELAPQVQPEPERLQLPPTMQAQCRAEGGCVLITRAKLAQALEEALAEALEQAIREHRAEICKGNI